ncbi:MAG: DUF2791 family P-loop domain-containing protein [Fimbriimonadaceae bacterium]|nr:DUF2791 family P-loop domain-containing protein [Fimbriimonadaceae bacterium]
MVRTEYLESFVRDGGGTVRLLGAGTDDLKAAFGQLRKSATDLGYHVVSLHPGRLREDGRKPHLHRMDRLTTTVLGSLSWGDLVDAQVRIALREMGLDEAPGGAGFDVGTLAAHNGRDPQDLRRRFERLVAAVALSDRNYCVEFRLAIAALVRARLLPSEVSATTERAVLNWFKGVQEPGAAAQLRRIGIHDRIGRLNARWVLQSVTHWLPKTGKTGLAVFLDLRPYERTPSSQSRSGEDGALHYSRPSYIQMLESLRRFLDDAEEFRSFVLFVGATPDFFAEGRRNYRDYDALYGRVANEIHPSGRPNPAAALTVLRAG